MTPDEQAYAFAFGKVLAKLRSRRDLSQADLARHAQIAQGTLSKIEAGQSLPDVITARRLALAVGVTYEALTQLVGQALTRTGEYARKVTNQPRTSDSWIEAVAVLAGMAGVTALVVLAVEALMKPEANKLKGKSAKKL